MANRATTSRVAELPAVCTISVQVATGTACRLQEPIHQITRAQKGVEFLLVITTGWTFFQLLVSWGPLLLHGAVMQQLQIVQLIVRTPLLASSSSGELGQQMQEPIGATRSYLQKILEFPEGWWCSPVHCMNFWTCLLWCCTQKISKIRCCAAAQMCQSLFKLLKPSKYFLELRISRTYQGVVEWKGR